jgi:hypothetical protein
MRSLILALMMISSTSAVAGDFGIKFKTVDGDKIATLELNGDIVRGDYEQYLNLVNLATDKKARIAIFVLNSDGGLVDESLKIGRHVRQIGLWTHTRAGTGCLSSCALIWFAGIRRSKENGSGVGVHRSYLKDGKGVGFGEMEKTLKKNHVLVQTYLEEMRSTNKTIETFLNTASTEMTFLGPSWVIDGKDYELDRVFEEYVISHCGKYPTTKKRSKPDAWQCFENENWSVQIGNAYGWIEPNNQKMSKLNSTTRALCREWEDYQRWHANRYSPTEKQRTWTNCSMSTLTLTQNELQFSN